MRVEYHESAMVYGDDIAHGLIRAEGALCADGKRRTAYRSNTHGMADTWFSIPAYVNVQHKRVYGYVTVETMNGYSTATEHDPATIKFVAYTYRKNHALVGGGNKFMRWADEVEDVAK